MGINMIKSILYICMTLLSIMSYGQSVNDKLKFFKQYAYCDCIFLNNSRLDSTYLSDIFQISDKSTNRFISLGKITEEQSQLVRDFTEKMTGNFYSIESPYYSESGKSNTMLCV